jgi:hypothetical protein
MIRVKDELHLLGTTDVQVFLDHVFKEDASADRSIQYLGKRKFDLEDGKLITLSGLTVLAGEGVGESSQPFAQEGIDFALR